MGPLFREETMNDLNLIRGIELTVVAIANLTNLLLAGLRREEKT